MPETVVSAWILASEVDYAGRYQEFTVDTTVNAPTTGSILLPVAGFYVYQVFYQDSLSNLNPTDNDVILLAEIGRCKVYD